MQNAAIAQQQNGATTKGQILARTVNRPVAMASSALLTVRGVEYGVGLTADGEALRVDLQDTQTGELWSGTFNTRCEGGSALTGP